MKKKLSIYFISILMITTGFLSSILYIGSNYVVQKNEEKNLKNINGLLCKVAEENEGKNFSDIFDPIMKEREQRLTIIGKNGDVLYDSKNDIKELENHNDRPEVINARKNGEARSIRLSDSDNEQTIYVAKLIKDDIVVRLSMQNVSLKTINNVFLKYYLYTFVIISLISVIISMKLSNIFIVPIKDLEATTSRVAKGDFERKVKVYSNDEVGQLATTFNYMSEQLNKLLQELNEKQTKLEAILKSMDSGVIAIDREEKIIMINPYCEKIFGIKQDIIGENIITAIRDADLYAVFKDSTTDVKEIKVYYPKEREFRIKTTEIINGYEVIGKVAVLQDITDIRRLENMRSQFVANVSHELKTPLTSIKGFAETLRIVEDKETKERFLDIINGEADRLTTLINDILTLSDLEQAKEMNNEDVDVNNIIESVYMMLKPLAEKKNISITKELIGTPVIEGDANKFKQMLINLVENAIKYTEDDGDVKIITNVINEKVIIKVQDNGIGISEEHIPRLFERFYRVDKARSREKGGTGLGLAIVKYIVINLGGTIKVESKIHEGTTFTTEFNTK
ncbi:sensor histidine kinase [Clostridium bornimense]|uniref:histidine kinase n=1 Tax=Clostridium bornimense TaxID=1216932 RepID=W6RZQ4_9CLOT|nr:ATP-binding protein [Clostridium bornimense]CDM69099.1 sensor histidine kinase [Clostridium bornimense]